MAALTVEIKLALLEAYVEGGESHEAAIARVHQIFGPENCPPDEEMIGFIEYFVNNGDDEDDPEIDYDSDSSIEQVIREPVLNIDARALHSLQDYFDKNPEASLAQAQADLNFDNWNDTAKEYFKLLHRYFIRIFHPSVEDEALARVELANHVLDAIEQNAMEIENIIFADIIHINLDNYIYKGTFRYFGEDLPYFSRARVRNNVDLAVYAAISFNSLTVEILPESPENDNGLSLVNVVKEKFGHDKLGAKKDKMWYIQDGTELNHPDLTSALAETFGDRVIGFKNEGFYANGIEYPQNTCFLSPCDFFLWGLFKTKVFESEPQTESDLISSIKRITESITPEMRQLAIRTAIRRLEFIKATNGAQAINVYI